MRFHFRPRLLGHFIPVCRSNNFITGKGHDCPTRRGLHLAPPFLLDDYMPRYRMLSSVEAATKRSLAHAHLRKCNLCPRLCGVNRFEKTGLCLVGATAKVNVIAPHFGEGMYAWCSVHVERFSAAWAEIWPSVTILKSHISLHKLLQLTVSGQHCCRRHSDSRS
jgi:hypothetical protein